MKKMKKKMKKNEKMKKKMKTWEFRESNSIRVNTFTSGTVLNSRNQ